MVDINRGTTGVDLPPEVSAEIWSKVTEQSVVQRSARQIPLPGNGVSIDLITGEATASWVDETEIKPISRPTVGNKKIRAYTVATIVPFSNQFRRDKAGLYNAMVRELPNALAKTFDRTVFGYQAAPGADFDTLAASPTVSVNTANSGYAGLLSALQVIGAADGEITHILGSGQATAKFLGQLDSTGRPIFNPTLGNNLGGSLLGFTYLQSRHVRRAAGGVGTDEILAIAGDWGGSAVWGQVGGINVSISDQATLTVDEGVINLWERNMFAVRVETELGFAVRDDDRFVRITGTPGA